MITTGAFMQLRKAVLLLSVVLFYFRREREDLQALITQKYIKKTENMTPFHDVKVRCLF